MITVKIDVKKLDQKRFFKGEKGTYCDLILIETPNGEYGDYMVKQSITKEERLAKLQMPILGNAKIMGQGSPARQASPAQQAKSNAVAPDEADVF
jgi:hypothetical protein